MAKKKKRSTSARFPKGYTGPTDADMVIEHPRTKPSKPPRGPKATKGTGKGSVGFSNGKRPVTPKGKKDPGGFASPGFHSEGFVGGGKKKKPRSGQAPPSVRERERKGGPPSQRPSSPERKKKPPPKFGEWRWGDIKPPRRPKNAPPRKVRPAKKKARKK
tara:strand:+ start:442 stop:921 length:480 start_codon:yes stop_codon:yes gene_type:complete